MHRPNHSVVELTAAGVDLQVICIGDPTPPPKQVKISNLERVASTYQASIRTIL